METTKEYSQLAKFAQNISGEFSSPLSVMIATLEDIKRSNKDEALKLQIDIALRNGYKFRTLLSDVFSIAKMHSGSILYTLVKDDIINFLQQLFLSFNSAAKERKIELSFHSNIENLSCYFDFQKVYKICYQLIANGIRFSKANDGLVKFTVFYSEENQELEINVWDNGIGIVPEKLPHIFSLNYDEDPIHLAHYQGTSLGLYATKRTIESMNGSIKVDSEKFMYTRFTVKLPIYKHRTDVPFEHVELLENVNIDQMVTSEEILHVDTSEIKEIKYKDNPSPIIVVASKNGNQPFWKKVFSESNKLVLTDNIDTAFAHIFELVPDIFILEHQLRGNSCVQTIEMLKKNSVVNHIPTVIFMPDCDLEMAQKIRIEAKADDFILNCSNPDQTRKRIENILENRRLVYKSAWNSAINEMKETKTLSLEDQFIKKMNNIIDTYISDEDFSVDKLSEEMYMSRTQIHRKLKTIANCSTTYYIKKYKLKKAYKDLENHIGNISEIAYKYGFRSPAYFSKVFHDYYDQKPSDIFKNNK